MVKKISKEIPDFDNISKCIVKKYFTKVFNR